MVARLSRDLGFSTTSTRQADDRFCPELVPNKMWLLQLGGLAFLFTLGSIVEKKAAMRGCHRNPLPAWFDRFLRVAFLTVLTGPSAYAIDTHIIGYPVLITTLILYLFTYCDLSEQRGGRVPYARRWNIAGWFIRRLGLKLERTADLPEDRAYIFGVHPHGILPFGAIIALSSERFFQAMFPKIHFRTLAATFCFYIPIYRDILLWTGVVDAARYSAHRVLEMGYSLALVPGGATEALYNHPDKDVVYLRKRLGFVKLALETGCSLVPVYSFNECNTFGVVGVNNPTINSIKQKFQRIFGISLPIITNIIPRKTNITVLIGSPIEVPKIENPTKEEVQKYLDIYIEALTKLYNDNREKYNEPPTKPPLEVL
eukprot:m.34734 g.34734  ORF g.34734 m.34734 type:complete len:371 (+) comp5256_c0_seq2:440-1552(+)